MSPQQTSTKSRKLAEGNIADTSLQSQQENKKAQTKWVKISDEEKDFLKLKQDRIEVMMEYAEPYHEHIKENIRLYEGKSKRKSTISTNDVVEVMPIARAFVEAKTSEEIKVTSTYRFTPKKDGRKDIFGNLIVDLDNHAKRVTGYKSNRHAMYRQKNIFGVAIKRKGYRLEKQWEKIPVKFDENNIPTEWKIEKVPMYDDLFEDIISPLQFAVDPNCTTINDAEDCYTFHTISKNQFDVMYKNDPRWINTEYVVEGAKFKLNNKGEFIFERGIKNEGVLIEEYFNKILNEWVVLANGVLISPIFESEKKHYGFPMPDLHRKLPFICFYNHSAFLVEAFGRTFTDGGSDEEFSSAVDFITGRETFWRKGDPHILRELISLETGLTQAMFRNAKLASQVIIATDRGYKFKSKKWKSGEQAIGMKGRYEVSPLGQSQQGQIQPLLDFLFQMKVLAIGIDPRNISQDNKTKSATEAAIIQETSMRRLNENIEFNIQNGELLDAEITLKLIAQYYSIAEMVRLTGDETIEDLELYHDVKKVKQIIIKDGEEIEKEIPIIGYKYRTSTAKHPVSETKGKDGKYLLTKSETGSHSFVVRPEYVKILDVDIEMTTENKLGEIQAVVKQQANELVNLFLTLYQAAAPSQDGSAPAIDKADLPPMKSVMRKLMSAYNMSNEWNEQQEGKESMSETSQIQEGMEQYMKNKKPPTGAPAPEPTPQEGPGTLSSSPNVNANVSTAS